MSFKSRLVSCLARFRMFGLYSLYKHGYLFEMGWFGSFSAKEPIDLSGKPIPWITYPCLSFLEGRIGKHMAVFEYGSGNSTLWWAERVERIISCEHDIAWYEKTKKLLPGNAHLSYVELDVGGEYSREILKYRDAFDIIVIDGRDRVNCARNVLTPLKNDGVVIWDNSERSSYQEGFELLKKQGFRRIDFNGIGPVNFYSWSTSIFYRETNCLGI